MGFSTLELSKLDMYETYYDKLQPYYGQEYIQFHYIGTDAFGLSVNTNDIFRKLKNLEDIFDFSNPYKNLELFSKQTRKLLANSK